MNQFLKLYEITNQRIVITSKILNNSLLKKSHFIGLLWLAYNKHTDSKIVKIHQTYRSKKDKTFPYHNKREYDISLKEKADILSDIWKKFSILQHKMMKSFSVSHFHFIQPNQHIPNSKILSTEEKENYFNKAEKIHVGFLSLLTKAKEMKDQGFTIFPLTDIYKTTTETVYRDSCCHINNTGREILEEEIFKTIFRYYNDKKTNN